MRFGEIRLLFLLQQKKPISRTVEQPLLVLDNFPLGLGGRQHLAGSLLGGAVRVPDFHHHIKGRIRVIIPASSRRRGQITAHVAAGEAEKYFSPMRR